MKTVLQTAAYPFSPPERGGDERSRTSGTVVHLFSKQARKTGMRVVSGLHT
jgi:hypothetical protein